MTRDDFRSMALAYPEATEGAHNGTSDFRVGKKIFATLGPRDPRWAVVKLARGDQKAITDAEPELFVPVAGAWGLLGYTQVNLDKAGRHTVRSALDVAWRNVAPRRLTKLHRP
jgi:hypothetical protein